MLSLTEALTSVLPLCRCTVLFTESSQIGTVGCFIKSWRIIKSSRRPEWASSEVFDPIEYRESRCLLGGLPPSMRRGSHLNEWLVIELPIRGLYLSLVASLMLYLQVDRVWVP
jgi:hypothetical protein